MHSFYGEDEDEEEKRNTKGSAHSSRERATA
jgi:hypothetical protein